MVRREQNEIFIVQLIEGSLAQTLCNTKRATSNKGMDRFDFEGFEMDANRS